jgi:hypothetical protein
MNTMLFPKNDDKISHGLIANVSCVQRPAPEVDHID